MQIFKTRSNGKAAARLVAVLAPAGVLGHAAPMFRGLLKLAGSYWD